MAFALEAGKTLDAAGFPRDINAIIKFHIDQVFQTHTIQQLECELTSRNVVTYYEIRFLSLPQEDVLLLVRDNEGHHFVVLSDQQ